MRQQSELVKEIQVMSEESRKIIEDISVIESDIDKYQAHIDHWIRKIDGMAAVVAKIRSTRQPLKTKATSIHKLKDYLQKEIKKNK